MGLAFCFSPFSIHPINLLTFTAPCICRASWPLRHSRAQSFHSLLGSRASLSRQPRAVAPSNLSPHRRGLQLISNQKRGKFFWVWPNTEKRETAAMHCAYACQPGFMNCSLMHYECCPRWVHRHWRGRTSSRRSVARPRGPDTHAAAQANNHAQKRLHSVCFLHPASGTTMLTADDVIRPGTAAIDLGVPRPEKARQKRVTGAAAARPTSRCWSCRPGRSGRGHWETSVSPRSE